MCTDIFAQATVGEDIILPRSTNPHDRFCSGEFVLSHNLVPFNQTLSFLAWREAESLPYSGVIIQRTERKTVAGRRGHDRALRNTPTNNNLFVTSAG